MISRSPPACAFPFPLNTDRDYSVGLHYILTSHLSVSTNYDNNLHWGVGLMLTY